jgi:hypothetical protein
VVVGILVTFGQALRGSLRAGLLLSFSLPLPPSLKTLWLAMLVLIYISADTAYLADRYYSLLMWIETRDQFKRLYGAVRSDGLSGERDAILEQQQEESRQLIPRVNVRFHISTTVSTINWLMVLWKLVSSLML